VTKTIVKIVLTLDVEAKKGIDGLIITKHPVKPADADIELSSRKDEEENLNQNNDEDDDSKKNRKAELEEIAKIFYEKKRTKSRIYPSVQDFMCMNCCFKPCKKFKQARYDILQRCVEITDKYLQINFLMNKFFEVEYMKKILLSKNERNLLKYQFKYINFNNIEESNRFLDSIQAEKAIVDEKLLEKDETEGNVNHKLILGVRDYFNF
jgi:hypothetical protein